MFNMLLVRFSAILGQDKRRNRISFGSFHTCCHLETPHTVHTNINECAQTHGKCNSIGQKTIWRHSRPLFVTKRINSLHRNFCLHVVNKFWELQPSHACALIVDKTLGEFGSNKGRRKLSGHSLASLYSCVHTNPTPPTYQEQTSTFADPSSCNSPNTLFRCGLTQDNGKFTTGKNFAFFDWNKRKFEARASPAQQQITKTKQQQTKNKRAHVFQRQ